MIKLRNNYPNKKIYNFRPNHDRRRNFGEFQVWDRYDRNEIWSLKIIEPERGKGYGTQMLSEFLQQWKSDKPLYLYVNKANEIAIRLYEKVGFIIVGDYSRGAYAMQYMGGNAI